MAKESKPAPGSSGGNRRQRLAALEANRKNQQRRRTVGLLVICVVLAGALLSYPIYLVVQDSRASSAAIADLGVPQADAGCDPVTENAASGTGNHVADGTKVPYPQPPDSGPHYASPAPFTKRFYTTDDRPAVETLVHNLEHGYTVLWYRDTAPQGDIDALAAIAKTFTSEEYDPGQKFIAAPWSEADGAGFPEGKNVVLAHWTTDPANPSDAARQRGVRQACTSASGAAIESFMQTYPSSTSPEPDGA